MPLINTPIGPSFDTTARMPAHRAFRVRRGVSKVVNISKGTDGNRRVSSWAASRQFMTGIARSSQPRCSVLGEHG